VVVVGQGVLGGLRVVLMQDAIGIVHATLAQVFLALLAGVALLTSRKWLDRDASWFDLGDRPARWRALILGTTALILAQLVIGATMRHRHAGLAVPDFPLAHGRVWPSTTPEAIARYNLERPEHRALNPVTAADVRWHMAHRLTGFGVLVLLIVAAAQARRDLGARHRLNRATVGWAVVGGFQASLGVLTVWTNKSADIATAHVAVGSLLLVGGVLLNMVAFRGQVPASFPRGEGLALLKAPLAAGARPSS
jgi:cytochrome c oxidase assembly protein subunit 15